MRYLINYTSQLSGSGRAIVAYLHSDTKLMHLVLLCQQLSREFADVELRCGNGWPEREQRGALLWAGGRFTQAADAISQGAD